MRRIVTHNGKFHADEVTCVALLTCYFAFKNIETTLLRTRDFSNFKEDDILVDVGLDYNHQKLHYDHHQTDFKETWSEKDTIILSSAGLVWRHYGNYIIEMYLSNNPEKYDNTFNYSEETIQDIKNNIYYELIEEIDANDNGIVYDKKNLNISQIIADLNEDITNEHIQYIKFNKSVSLVGEIFDINFKKIIDTYFDFQKDLEIVSQMDLTHPFIGVDKNIPTLFKCLDVLDPDFNVKFCIFENKNEYTIKTRRIDKFLPICPIIPEDKIKELCDSDDIIFVHKSNFMAKVKSLETAIKIVKFSLLDDVEKEDNSYKYIGASTLFLAGMTFLYWKFKICKEE